MVGKLILHLPFQSIESLFNLPTVEERAEEQDIEVWDSQSEESSGDEEASMEAIVSSDSDEEESTVYKENVDDSELESTEEQREENPEPKADPSTPSTEASEKPSCSRSLFGKEKLPCSTVQEELLSSDPEKDETEEMVETYSLVCDNLNKQFGARHYSSKKSGTKLDCVSVVGLIHRVPQCKDNILDTSLTPTAVSLPLDAFVPVQQDVELLQKEQRFLIRNILVEHVSAFGCLKSKTNVLFGNNNVSFSSKKSKVVNLGVVNENENTTSGMVNLLCELKRYSPDRSEGEKMKLVLWGDGLTAHRMQAAKNLRNAGKRVDEQLNEFVAGIGSWHKRVLLCGIDMCKLFVKPELCKSVGSLPYLRNRFGHTKVFSKTKNCFNASTRFYRFAYVSYILAAACQFLGLKNYDEELDDGGDLESKLDAVVEQIFQYQWLGFEKSVLQKKYCYCQREYSDPETVDLTWLGCENSLCKKFQWYHQECLEAQNVRVSDYLDDSGELDASEGEGESEREEEMVARDFEDKHVYGNKPGRKKKETFFCSPECENECKDKVNLYSRALIFTGLLQEGFRNSIRENDGDRMLAHTKFHLLRVFNGRHFTYQSIIVRMLADLAGHSGKAVAFDLKHNSTVNVVGGANKNLETDLFNEFVNKLLKECISSLQGKITDRALQRKTRTMSIVREISKVVEEEMCLDEGMTRKNKDGVCKDDLSEAVSLILENELLVYKGERHHEGFGKFNVDFLAVENVVELEKKIRILCRKIDLEKELLQLPT